MGGSFSKLVLISSLLAFTIYSDGLDKRHEIFVPRNHIPENLNSQKGTYSLNGKSKPGPRSGTPNPSEMIEALDYVIEKSGKADTYAGKAASMFVNAGGSIEKVLNDVKIDLSIKRLIPRIKISFESSSKAHRPHYRPSYGNDYQKVHKKGPNSNFLTRWSVGFNGRGGNISTKYRF